MSAKQAAVLFSTVLVGCATTKVEYVPFEVKVPVAVSCAAKIPDPPPALIAALKKADTLDKKVQVILADLENSKGYIEQLKAAVAGCR